jgi:phospholipid/cholesterol/gamma-HCH transport system substrate-binding protein
LNRTAEIAVGAVVLAAVAVLVIGIYWLRDVASGRELRVWHVRFTQTGGLGKSDEVQVNGVRKGTVKDLYLRGDQVLVDLALSEEIQLTTESRVSIRNVGLMGEKVISVDLSLAGRPYTERDTIQGIYELGMGEVMAGMGETMSAVNALATELKNITAEMNRGSAIAQTIENFRMTSEELRQLLGENSDALSRTLRNFEAASATTKSLTTDREAELRRSLDQFSVAADNMARLTVRLDSLRTSIQGITTKIDDGEGTLGKLVNDDKLYSDVKTSVNSLQVLVEDIKKNPRRYIRLSIF